LLESLGNLLEFQPGLSSDARGGKETMQSYVLHGIFYAWGLANLEAKEWCHIQSWATLFSKLEVVLSEGGQVKGQ
jgi:hypothetical protein